MTTALDITSFNYSIRELDRRPFLRSGPLLTSGPLLLWRERIPTTVLGKRGIGTAA